MTPVSQLPRATISTSPTVVAHGWEPCRRLLVEVAATEEQPKKRRVERTLTPQASTPQQSESAGGLLNLHPTMEDFPEPRHSRLWMVGQAGCRGAPHGSLTWPTIVAAARWLMLFGGMQLPPRCWPWLCRPTQHSNRPLKLSWNDWGSDWPPHPVNSSRHREVSLDWGHDRQICEARNCPFHRRC